MENQTNQPENNWKEVEHIVRRILLRIIWGIFLRPKSCLIHCRYTRQPVTAHCVAVSLNIILSTRKVPHKVSPIHPVNLVIVEVSQVLSHRRKSLFIRTELCSFVFRSIISRPTFVTSYLMGILTPIHSREYCLLLVSPYRTFTDRFIRDIVLIYYNRSSEFGRVFVRTFLVFKCFYILIPSRHNKTT